MQIYVLSGLGADESIFQKLDFGDWQPVYIQWITPLKKESLESYASRLLLQVKSERPILLGVSFGGMLAVEMAKLIDCQKIILISSAAARTEIPRMYRFSGRTGLVGLLPASLLKTANFFTYRLFGMKTVAEKTLLKNILKNTDTSFLKWAMEAIVTWKNETVMPGIMRIHGDADRILPLRHMKQVQEVVRGGGHLMVYSKAARISAFLSKIKP